MYYLIRDTSDNDYCYIYSKDDVRVTSSGNWMSSAADALPYPHDTQGNWDSISQLKANSSFRFLCSSPNPITPNSHPELFI